MTFRASLLTAVAAFVTLGLVLGSGPTLKGQGPRGTAALMDPAELKEQAPATFKVNFDTSAGLFVIEVPRDWAPRGADRFYNLVKRGFYDGCRFYRVMPGFMAQFGLNGDPAVIKIWLDATPPTPGIPRARIPDDPRGKQSNKKGIVTFTATGLDRRSTLIFINLADNLLMDRQTIPFGQVVSGMNVVEKLYSGYGELAPSGNGPDLNRLYSEGNAYLEKEFPKFYFIKTATIVP